MRIKVGEIEALFRYPVKSMAGESVVEAELGWHGLMGDRRLSFRRLGELGGFPWLTASRLPELLLFAPLRRGPDVVEDIPTHVRTPEGRELELSGPELAAEISRRFGAPVELVYLNRGIFDEASISLVTAATLEESGRMTSMPADVRRYRPNLLVRTFSGLPFEEDRWVEGLLTFGEGPGAPALFVTHRDERCSMVNFDPDTAQATPEVLRVIARQRDNRLGVYASVVRRGRLSVGQPVFFAPTRTEGH
jgi:uncharacterized protein YcbX